jgi:hypothetical protein
MDWPHKLHCAHCAVALHYTTYSGWVLVACEQLRNYIAAIQSTPGYPRVQESGNIVSLPIPTPIPCHEFFRAHRRQSGRISAHTILCCSAKALLTKLGQSATQRSGFSDFKPVDTATTPAGAEFAAAPAGAPSSFSPQGAIASSHAYENSRNFT